MNVKEPSLITEILSLSKPPTHQRFEDVLLGESSKICKRLPAYIDVIVLLTGSWLMNAKNVDAQWYQHIPALRPGDKIYMGPIWDFDLGFGNVDYADATYPNDGNDGILGSVEC